MDVEKGFGYIGYQQMITDIASSLEDTAEVMTLLELNNQAQKARDTSKRMKAHVFSVGIMGEFKRGKSTVINALLGKKIAPADVVPASATLNRITYGPVPRATILYKDGHCEEVPVDKIADYVTKITESAAATAELVEQAVVEYPCQFCQNNVEIIDTPGLNDDDRMDAISEAVIPTLDAVVLVLSASSPFSKSEAEFVRNKLMTSDISRMIVLVNRIDTIYDEEDRVRILDSIKEKIVHEILDRTAAIHGADSRIYQDARSKLADIKIYPLSAVQALQGRIKGKAELVEQSGILNFEDRLRKLLTQERGALEIGRAAGVITTLVAEGKSALEVRISSLEMTAEEFATNQRKAEAEIRQLRESKSQEMSRIRNQGREIKRQMAGIVEEKYDALEQRVDAFLGTYPIEVSVLQNESTQTEFQQKVKAGLESEISGALSEYAEQINIFLQEQMGDERLKVQSYMGGLAEQLQNVNGKLKKSSAADTVGIVGVDALSNLVAATCTGILTAGGFGLMGLGGMIEGYRAAGVKGAATGLFGGFTASTLAGVGLIAAMGVVPFIPFALITGIAGTMGGKLLSSAIWKKDMDKKKIEELRGELKKSAKATIASLREQKLLENWAQKQVQEQIDALVAQVESDAESMISSTEATLESIAADMAKADHTKEQRLEEYRRLGEKLESVSSRVVPILKKVSGIAG